MIYWIIVLVIWLVGIIPAYMVIKKWNNAKSEKIYFSIVWPLLLPLFLIHLFHNKE